MKMDAEINNDGGVSVLVSPIKSYHYDTLITADIVAAIEDWDSTATLIVVMLDESGLPSNKLLTVSPSSISEQALQRVEFCMPEGNHSLAFYGTWGLNTVPFLAVDDVVVTGRACVAKPETIGFIVSKSIITLGV